MIAHSAAVCQCSSRIPPAVRRMFTPAIAFDTGSSRTVTSRDHPPSKVRRFESENGYLKVGTPPESVSGGTLTSGFALSRDLSVGPGSVMRVLRPVETFSDDCAEAVSATERMPATPATAAEPSSRNPRREISLESFSSLIIEAPYSVCLLLAEFNASWTSGEPTLELSSR